MMNRMRRRSIALFSTVALITTAAEPVDMSKRTEELKDLKWGMFICWSFSTFSGKEWTPGIDDHSFFRATSVDTDQWARTAKEAGMGYILFLTKHHDGFCLWDTQTTDRKVTKAPLGRDVLAELKKSCDKYGIKLALYFSEGEWRHPGGLDHPDTTGEKKSTQGGRDPEMKKAQLKELLTQYGPIEYIWFDHAVGDGGLSHAETIAFCKALQPGCFIGFNHGDQKGADIRLGELGRPGPLTDSAAGPYMSNASSSSYLLAEFTYPIQPSRPKGAMWFYSHPDNEGVCHSPEKLYRDYLGAVKYGNVFALDVGPNYEGKLRDIDVQTLRKVGEMIRSKVVLPEPLVPIREILASSTWGYGYEAANAYDNYDESRWAAERGARSGWLEIDLGKETLIGGAGVIEISYPRTESFAVEYKHGEEWKPLHQGTTINGRRVYEFAPVSTRFVRLNILKANGEPSIEEFLVYAPGTKLPDIFKERTADQAHTLTNPINENNWMANTRFGMFIHFGLYSLPAGVWQGEGMGRNHYAEWIRAQWRWPQPGGIPKKEYDALLAQFNPAKFDADEWISLAAKAGMRYFVITTKHHDGFALWDSAVSDYDIAATPFGAKGRDLLGELATACRKYGVKLGFYYSHWQDWEHPGGALPPWPEVKNDPPLTQPSDEQFAEYWEGKCLPQVTELIDRYQPDMFWFDTWDQGAKDQVTAARRDQLIALIREKAPACMINGRIAAHDPSGADFISMGDNHYPDARNAPKVPWETPGTMNHSWGYNRFDFQWKPFDRLLDTLITNAHHGGAITLNVGPLGDGSFQQAAKRRLREFAAWMEINESALQPSRRSPFAPGALPENLRATLHPEGAPPHFNLFVLRPLPAGDLTLPQPLALHAAAEFRAQVLETRQWLDVKRDATGQLVLNIPATLAQIDHPVIRVGPASSLPALYEDGAPVEPVRPGTVAR
jgi:alpha-L-fucosidase